VALKLENLDLHEVIREAIKICRSASEAKKVLITAHLASSTHHVSADRTRLRQVFWNLLNNAIKFTDPGGKIAVASSELDNTAVRVSVRDTGVGMDSSVLETLFLPFDRRPVADESRSGLGLGLAICKGIMAAHGGRIGAASEGPGRGSLFVVELTTVAPPAESAVEPPEAVASVEGHVSKVTRVLVVEDDGDSSEMIGQLLGQRGYRVEVVSSFSVALRKLAEPWDILLSDIGLPDGSGLELARRARQMPHPPHRLIAFTGYGSSEDILASREAGFDSHVVKPIDIDSLLSSLEPEGWSRASVEPHGPRPVPGSTGDAREMERENRGKNPGIRDSGFRTRETDPDA
jgi:CheY-like chemotaxis protein